MNRGANGSWAWRDVDVVLVGLLGMLGLVAIVAGWFGASGTVSSGTQAFWLNVAFAGFVVTAVGFGLWLMRGRAAVGARRVSLIALEHPPAPAPAQPPQTLRPGTAPIQAVRVPGTRLVHDSACPLVFGKEYELVAPGSGQPCGVCTP